MKRGIVVIGAALWLLIMASESSGEMKITPDGIAFPNTSTQTMAAAPPWSQKLEGSDRFTLVLPVVSGSLTFCFSVLDRETGLVWERDTDHTLRDWIEAWAYCYNKEIGGRKGWRLPTVEELSSLVDTSQSDPALPAGHLFSNVKSEYYWSSSTSAENPGYAWYVGFRNGYVSNYFKTMGCYVRCVRGGHGHNAQ